MTITPLDIDNVEFPKKFFGGYDADAVDEFLEEVSRTLVSHIEEAGDLQGKIEQLTQEIAAFRAREDLVSQSVQLAQKTQDEVIGAAKKNAENIIKQARLDEVRIKNEFASLRADREAFEFEFYGLLKGFIEKLERKNPGFARPDIEKGTISGDETHSVGIEGQ